MTAYFNIKESPYGAVGDYVTDDTTAIQAAINDAEAVGGRLIAPRGCYHTTAPLVISDHLLIEGDGYPDDGGALYAAGYGGIPLVFNNNMKGTVFYPNAHDCFQVTSNNAVQMQQFQICYNQSAPSGSNLIAIHNSPASGINCHSVFRDIGIQNADNGILMNNMLEFRIDNINILYSFINSIVISNPAYPSFGDSFIQGCTLWGSKVLTAHINVMSHGGLRIINNKTNDGNPTTSVGVLFNPTLTVAQNMEPIVMAGNSLEGQAVGICFVNAHPTTASMTEVVITGNQIWAGTNAILANTSGTTKWLAGFTICGNVLMTLNGSTQPVILIDNASMGIITGNQIAFSGSPGGTGIILGAKTSGINVQSNVYGANITTKVNNAGTGNTIGGGSM